MALSITSFQLAAMGSSRRHAEPHAADVVGGEQVGDVLEVVEQFGRVAGDVDEDEPLPGVEAQLGEPELGGVQRGGEQVPAGDAGEASSSSKVQPW